MKRPVIALAGFLALIYAGLSTTPAEMQAPATVLYLPVVGAAHPSADVRKGIAGFTFSPTLTSAQSYRAMGIGSSYNWQTMLTPTWNVSNAYPLPSQPLNDFRSLPNLPWFSMFRLGLTCDTTQQGLAECAASVVRGQGVIYCLFGNEADNNDQNAGDNLSPTEEAMDFKLVRDTVWASNPQVKWVFGNYLFPNAYYFNAVKSEFQRLYGEDIRNSIAVYGWHLYSNLGAACPSPARYPQDAQCVSNAFASDLYDITSTVKTIDPSKLVWLTEIGISGGAETAEPDYAQMMPDMCRQIRAEPKVERFFMFIATPYPPTPNAWLLDESGALTVLGSAYAAC